MNNDKTDWGKRIGKMLTYGAFFVGHIMFYDLFWGLMFATIVLSLEVMFGR